MGTCSLDFLPCVKILSVGENLSWNLLSIYFFFSVDCIVHVKGNLSSKRHAVMVVMPVS